MRTQRNFLIAITILLICYSAQATAQTTAEVTTEATAKPQEAQYKIVNGEVVKIKSAQQSAKKSIKTELVYKVKNIAYPVCQGSKGGYYVLRTSKKSGKQYKQYLKIKK